MTFCNSPELDVAGKWPETDHYWAQPTSSAATSPENEEETERGREEVRLNIGFGKENEGKKRKMMNL